MATEPINLLVSEPEVLSFKRSASIGKLVGAMCKAQLAFDPIYKESENPAFKRGNRVSKYADLFSLVTATRKHLNANGITIMQFPTVTMAGKNLVVTTLLAHESDEWISHELLIPATDERGFTAHSIGKAMTYARRFSWQSVIGAVAEDDDDGNEASGQGTREAAQEVGARKIADLKSKKEYQPAPTTLFYVWPDRHNGNYAEFMNYKEYAAGLDQVAAEGLRKVIAPFASKNLSKIGSPIIPSDQMQPLLEKLAGDCGIEVHELKANREPGE